jgi:protein tyrosine phosphatase
MPELHDVCFPISKIEEYMFNFAGPKADTVDDFWLMIWQYDINRIVVLTRLVENAKVGKFV